ncbi:MAG: Unknown protein [uncultured Sulfurovum sp.]|uniref:Uncharacterized protein n=1 Tax=uncultured Sulfurovum sp. TaxID=269237 RepID=A0A6S6T2R0_9BACT|nr:MAG: Unknown protein [uncultured Sulfurovum sp.]
MNDISEAFLTKISEVLADTDAGLSGSKIVKYFADFAVDFDKNIPYSDYPFPKGTPNKRTAFKKNLKVFTPKQQFKIIAYLVDLEKFRNNEEANKLKILLFERYENLNVDTIETNTNISDMKHWLSGYPTPLKLYNQATKQLELNIFQRNLLDNLRLSLELLLKSILSNDKSLENQQRALGIFIKNNNSSKELHNMFLKLIDYYTKYHNEIEMIFDLTSLFMRFLIKIKEV